MVDTFAWNDDADMISAIVDGKFVVWYYPNVIFIDEDVEPCTRFEKDGRCVLIYLIYKCNPKIYPVNSAKTLNLSILLVHSVH